MPDIPAIIAALDEYLETKQLTSIDPVKGNKYLEEIGLLKDSKSRKGKPLRELLRKNLFPHAYQKGGKGSDWIIPHSSTKHSILSNYKNTIKEKPRVKDKKLKEKRQDVNLEEIKKQIESARDQFRPKPIKCLLIAEAPPDSIDRFFYYLDVKKDDHLFLGIMQALYPNLKSEYISKKRSSDLKEALLNKFKADGFFLIDLSDLPIIYVGNLSSQIPDLLAKVESLIDKTTPIILIKHVVYDLAYHELINAGFLNVVNIRMPFPGSGQQKRFQEEFEEAFKQVKGIKR